MKNLKILGTGCPKCAQLAEMTDRAAKELNIEYEIEKVTDIQEIIGYGVMCPPALVVDEDVKVTGRVPSIEELKKMIAALVIAFSFFFPAAAFAGSATAEASVSAPSTAEVNIPGAAQTSEVAAQKSGTGEISIYYFYTAARCPSCLKIEAYTKDAINAAFAGELKDGRLVWKMVNYEEPANEHFVKKYQLFTKSVVLDDAGNDRWKVLEKVWELLGDEEAFKKYITDETKAFIEEKK